ncbi:hypothetical protein ABZU76_10990 [Amycolatopsis sp. NPDC005232]|uniref:hypothetical protein n=1 Tax=Amycolatopsis sp. NPDC005232 TaxID=3157027 RepID=UPI0033A84D51
MELTHLHTTSKNGGCPELYETDRGTYVVQGAKVTDPQALVALRERGFPEHETAVEVPKALLQYFVQGGV